MILSSPTQNVTSNQNYTFTVDKSLYDTVRIGISNGNLSGTNTITFNKIQLEQSSSATPYTPYEEKNYGLDLLKNLFNFDGVSNNTIATFANGIATLNWTTGFDCFLLNNGSQYLNDLDSGKKYTISFEHKGDKIRLKDYLSSESITTETNNDFKRYSFDITGISSLRLDIVRTDTSGTAQIKNVKVYTERIEMYNINGVYDGFVYDETEDKFYIERLLKKIIFNGEENWNTSTNVYYLANIIDYKVSDNIPMSNYFRGVTNVGGAGGIFNIPDDNICAFISQSGSVTPRFYIKALQFENATAFKNYLRAKYTDDNPVFIIYALDNTALEPIEKNSTLDIQLRAIKNALSMQGATHIISTSSGTNLPFLIKARAVQTIERT